MHTAQFGTVFERSCPPLLCGMLDNNHAARFLA